MQTFKLFVSSPGDAIVERHRVENVVSRLNGEFAGSARLETIRWETKNYQSYSTFQDQIPLSTSSDLVIGILKWRLGTELPPDFKEKLADNRSYPSGTAYEILTANEKRRKGDALPDIYVFRFSGSSPPLTVDDPDRERIEHDWQALKGFFQEWFLTEQGHFKGAFNPYASEDDFEAQLDKLLRGWVADKVAGGRVVRWPIEVKGSPFCGLAAFDAKHAPVFFGRSHDIGRAVELWREAADRGSPYMLVVGSSGAGKSSLAAAGLLPRLTTPGVIKPVDLWRSAVMRPGDSLGGPFAALADALMQGGNGVEKVALPEIARGDSRTPAELAAVLRHADASAVKPVVNALMADAADARARESYGRDVRCDLVLLVDQLDELFAASVSAEERSSFIDLLAALVGTGRVWVVATLRADFYARMLDQPGLRKLKELGATYDLSPPGPVELAEIVRGPAEAAGLVYETDTATGESLDVRLLRDADRPDMLPLVQLALSRLFAGRETVKGELRLRLKVYDDLGGLKGIVDEAGEQALAPLGEVERAWLPRLLRQLAVPAHAEGGGGTGALTIRAVPMSQAAPDAAARRLVDALVSARLLTTSGVDADAQVRLAHQRVLEDWARARTLAAESADFYRVRADVEDSRRKWDAGKHRSELLLPRGLPLAEAQNIVAKYADELAPELIAYVKVSRARANRLQMIGWAAAAAFALLAIGAGVAAKDAHDESIAYRAAAKLAHDQSVAAEAAAKLAQDQSVAAELARQDAVHQRNHASENESRYFADRGMLALRGNDAISAALIALAGLPDSRTGVERPYAPQAEATLFAASQGVQEVAVLAGHDGHGVSSAAYSPDGRRVVTASKDKTARIWDAESHRQIGVLEGHDDEVTSAAFSRDGRRVVTTSKDKTARIWDAESFKPIATLEGPDTAVTSAAFSPDGRRVVTAAEDHNAHIWDIESRRLIGTLKGHEDMVSSAAFSPDGRRVVTASWDHTARIWDATTLRQIGTLTGHEYEVRSAAFSPDGRRLVTASGDRSVRLWDAETRQQIGALPEQSDVVNAATFSPDGRRLVTASNDNTARIWDAITYQPIAVLAGHDDTVFSAAFSPDGRHVVTASKDGTVRIWDAEAHPRFAVLASHDDGLAKAAFSPDGRRVVTASDDGKARIWDAATGQRIATLAHDDVVWSAAFSPDGRRVVTASEDGTACIWDAATGQRIATLAHESAVSSAAFSPDGRRVVTASDDGTARIWDAASFKPVAVLVGHKQAAYSAAFSPDGRRVVTGSLDNTARIWDAETYQQIAVLRGHDHAVYRAAFSPDGRRVATASQDRTARIWDAETYQTIAVLRGHNSGVSSVAFSPDGRRVVTASKDKTAWIWDVETHETIAVLTGHGDDLVDAEFSPDGRRVVTASLDKTARIWDLFLTTQELVDYTKRIVPRCLTRTRREQAFLDPEPPAWCIETEKWPYASQDWKDWLHSKQGNANPPLPDTPQWKPWRAAR